jgi:hypothetical protein
MTHPSSRHQYLAPVSVHMMSVAMLMQGFDAADWEEFVGDDLELGSSNRYYTVVGLPMPPCDQTPPSGSTPPQVHAQTMARQ